MKKYEAVKLFLTSALDGGDWSDSRSDRFPARQRALITYKTGGWMGPRSVLGAVENRKISSLWREQNSDSSLIEALTRRWFIPAPFWSAEVFKVEMITVFELKNNQHFQTSLVSQLHHEAYTS
jgi:hypothetical protein